jgi:hypothetical protein
LTSALDGEEWSASRPGRFTPREKAAGTRWIGGWSGPSAVLDAVVKRKIPSHVKLYFIFYNLMFKFLERRQEDKRFCKKNLRIFLFFFFFFMPFSGVGISFYLWIL